MEPDRPPILDYRQPSGEPEDSRRPSPLVAVAVGVIGLLFLGAVLLVHQVRFVPDDLLHAAEKAMAGAGIAGRA